MIFLKHKLKDKTFRDKLEKAMFDAHWGVLDNPSGNRDVSYRTAVMFLELMEEHDYVLIKLPSYGWGKDSPLNG
jgi:hypothetical protein